VWYSNEGRDFLGFARIPFAGNLVPNMDSFPIQGHVDDQHRLSAVVPGSIPPGPVTVWLAAGSCDDDAGAAWMNGISLQWAQELSDSREDIYTLADGDAVDPA
jgi:hypothetical protein